MTRRAAFVARRTFSTHFPGTLGAHFPGTLGAHFPGTLGAHFLCGLSLPSGLLSSS